LEETGIAGTDGMTTATNVANIALRSLRSIMYNFRRREPGDSSYDERRVT
jgi:hypothetical protein